MDRLTCLYNDYSHIITGYLTRRGLTPEDAEDVASLVWERAWRHLSELRDPALPWLLVVAHNLTMDHYRRQRARPVATPLAVLDWWRSRPGPEASVVDQVALVARLAAADLSADQAVVVRLKANEYTEHEIAGLLGIPHGTVKSRLALARAKLSAGSAA